MTDKTIAKKEKALELLKEMDIYKPYIRGFVQLPCLCRDTRIYAIRRTVRFKIFILYHLYYSTNATKNQGNEYILK